MGIVWMVTIVLITRECGLFTCVLRTTHPVIDAIYHDESREEAAWLSGLSSAKSSQPCANIYPFLN